MDELAHAAQADPLAFRLAHLKNDRLRAVLEKAAKEFAWADRRRQPAANTGVGLACGTEKGSYVATCAEVEVDRSDGEVHVRRVCQAFECGTVLNPANLIAQNQGCVIMGLGGVLMEEIRFHDGRILNPRFATYAVPRFKDVPKIDVHLVNRTDLAPLGPEKRRSLASPPRWPMPCFTPPAYGSGPCRSAARSCMASIYGKIVELIDGGGGLAAALVLSTQGSTPQQAGVRAVVEQSGRLWGTVGGGAVEAEVQRTAAEACQSQRPCLLDFEMNSQDAADEGAICGGQMRVLVDPTVARHRSCFAQAADALANRCHGCLVTRIRTLPEVQVEVQWLTPDSLSAAATFPGGDAIRSCLESGQPGRFVADEQASTDGEEVFVEPVVPNPLLLIAGGGHVGQAVAGEALRVGFDVTVIDDRPEFTAAALFRQASVSSAVPFQSRSTFALWAKIAT